MGSVKAVLCDIEGTTTALSFVHDVLFPLSKREMDSFVRGNWDDPELQKLFAQLGKYSPEEVVALLQSWIDQDKKETVLKQIQGRIWKHSFESGLVRSHMYPDVPETWSEWKKRGLKIYIFSSGSIEAQQLLFRYSEAGDLTFLIDGYFDTTTGPKKETASYARIANSLKLLPEEVLFLSDVVAELDAARAAGMQTIQLIRDQAEPGDHPAAKTFTDIQIHHRGR